MGQVNKKGETSMSPLFYIFILRRSSFVENNNVAPAALLFSTDVFIVRHSSGPVNQMRQLGVRNEKKQTPHKH